MSIIKQLSRLSDITAEKNFQVVVPLNDEDTGTSIATGTVVTYALTVDATGEEIIPQKTGVYDGGEGAWILSFTTSETANLLVDPLDSDSELVSTRVRLEVHVGDPYYDTLGTVLRAGKTSA